MGDKSALFLSCPNCAAVLHERASFCPYCAQSINPREEPKRPYPMLGKVLCIAAILLVLVGISLGGYLSGRPQVYDGAGEVIYRDRDGAYQLLLSYVDTPYLPLPERVDTAELDGQYRAPSCLFIHFQDSGADAATEFLPKVERVTAAFLQPSDNVSPMRCSDPAPSAAVPDAVMISSVDFTGRSGTAELVWTFQMKNGDTIFLRQKYTAKPVQAVSYDSEHTAMNTVEELQALIQEIEQTVDEQDIVNIYLPPITYEGGLVIKDRPVNLYGSTGGDQRTTFTDTVRTTETNQHPHISYFRNIDFIGTGNKVGVSASARLHLIGCTVTGWKTGFLGYGDTWVNITDCRFEGNGIGFHFNSGGVSVSHTQYNGNSFIDNQTAVLLERVPTDTLLDFGQCIFSGNETDIDNQCNQPLDISEAIFR